MDLIGHDTNFAVTRSVYDANFQDKRFVPSLLQAELVAGGLLGRKSGRGFYPYPAGASRVDVPTLDAPVPARVLCVLGAGAVAERLFDALRRALPGSDVAREPAHPGVGLRVDEAREALGEFIRTAHKNGVRCVRVVHGKGLGSPGKSPVLKSRVQRWLVQKHEVLAFVQARPVDGGAGAMLVLLQPVGGRQR